jgi:hypothetical protein
MLAVAVGDSLPSGSDGTQSPAAAAQLHVIHMWSFKPKLDGFGRSDLHYAARAGDRKLAEGLIRRGADVALA